MRHLVGNEMAGKCGVLAPVVNIIIREGGNVGAEIGAVSVAPDGVFKQQGDIADGQRFPHQLLGAADAVFQQINAAPGARLGADHRQVHAAGVGQINPPPFHRNPLRVEQRINQGRVGIPNAGEDGNDAGPVVGNAAAQGRMGHNLPENRRIKPCQPAQRFYGNHIRRFQRSQKGHTDNALGQPGVLIHNVAQIVHNGVFGGGDAVGKPGQGGHRRRQLGIIIGDVIQV